MMWNKIFDEFGMAYWKATEKGYDVAFLLFLPEPEDRDRWAVCLSSGNTIEEAYDCPLLAYLTDAMPRKDAEKHLREYMRTH